MRRSGGVRFLLVSRPLHSWLLWAAQRYIQYNIWNSIVLDKNGSIHVLADRANDLTLFLSVRLIGLLILGLSAASMLPKTCKSRKPALVV
jgi:hypothetical protein